MQHIARYIAVILIFTGALLPGFSSQLNKLPSLVNHYRHHIEEHRTITVTDFFALHYGSMASQHREEEDHQDLPFFQMSSSQVLAITQDCDITLDLCLNAASPQQGFCIPVFYNDHKPQGIFQPPRA